MNDRKLRFTVTRGPATSGADMDPLLAAEKRRRVHARALELRLTTGDPAWVEELHLTRTHAGILEGVPGPGFAKDAIEAAEAFARNAFPGPKPVLLAPEAFDPASPNPILPPLRIVAQIVSWRLLEPYACGSWLNLVWFAESDDGKPLKHIVGEALERVDWASEASSFDI